MTTPRHLGILLTARCNLTCRHCLQYRHFKHDLDPAFCKRLLREATHIGIDRVSFSGGEPTLYPHLDEIVALCLENKQGYSITTNGTLYEPLLRAAMIHAPSHITISFEGARRGIHDRVRGIGTYDKALQTARLLIAAGIHVRVQCTLLSTLLKEIESIELLLDDTGADELVLVPPIVTENIVRDGQDPQISNLINIQQWIAKYRAQGRIVSLALGDEIISNNRPYGFIPCQYLRGESLFVDWMGKLALCCQTSGIALSEREVIGDLLQESLATLLERKKLWMNHFFRMRGEGSATFACSDCLKTLAY